MTTTAALDALATLYAAAALVAPGLFGIVAMVALVGMLAMAIGGVTEGDD